MKINKRVSNKRKKKEKRGVRRGKIKEGRKADTIESNGNRDTFSFVARRNTCPSSPFLEWSGEWNERARLDKSARLPVFINTLTLHEFEASAERRGRRIRDSNSFSFSPSLARARERARGRRRLPPHKSPRFLFGSSLRYEIVRIVEIHHDPGSLL